jgi:hypothetical protein
MGVLGAKLESMKDPNAVALGRLGGLARAKVLKARRRVEIARKAALARWSKKGQSNAITLSSD